MFGNGVGHRSDIIIIGGIYEPICFVRIISYPIRSYPNIRDNIRCPEYSENIRSSTEYPIRSVKIKKL